MLLSQWTFYQEIRCKKDFTLYTFISIDVSIHDNYMPHFSLREIREFTRTTTEVLSMLQYRGSKWDLQKWELGSVVKGKLNACMRQRLPS